MFLLYNYQYYFLMSCSLMLLISYWMRLHGTKLCSHPQKSSWIDCNCIWWNELEILLQESFIIVFFLLEVQQQLFQKMGLRREARLDCILLDWGWSLFGGESKVLRYLELSYILVFIFIDKIIIIKHIGQRRKGIKYGEWKMIKLYHQTLGLKFINQFQNTEVINQSNSVFLQFFSNYLYRCIQIFILLEIQSSQRFYFLPTCYENNKCKQQSKILENTILFLTLKSQQSQTIFSSNSLERAFAFRIVWVIDQNERLIQYFRIIAFLNTLMGKCASSPVHKKGATPHDRQFVEAESFKHKKLPKLYFHAVLANVIIKKYPYKKANPIFKLEQDQFTLQPKQRNGEQAIKWKIHEKFSFEMTEYQLRKSCLEVCILNEQNARIGRVRINTFLITTGPFHQDFALEFANGSFGRISFDLKISQIISLQIQSISAEIFLLKDHPGEAFSYSIKTIVGYNGSTAESLPSYPAMVLLEKKKNELAPQSQDMMQRQMNFTRRKSLRMQTKELDVGHNLIWLQEGGSIPSLQTKVLASQLHNTYFQILIWKEQGTQDQPKRQLFADSYVSFYKLFGEEANIIMKEHEQYESRNINMTQKIQRYGKDYGKGSFSFKIINQPYFRQYQTCVHTEVGILKAAPIFNAQQTKTSQKCAQLKELLKISQIVEQNVIILNRLESDEASHGQIRKVKTQLESDLQKIFHILQKSCQPRGFIYKYSSQGDLLRGQKILVQLGMKISKYFEIQDPIINDVAWLIMLSLIKRSEFNLTHMGFQEKQKQLIQNRTIDKTLMEKLKIGGIYKMLLYKLLNLALNSLNRKGSQYERTFAEVFSAYAYFRIPQFRKQVLRLITHENDPEIIEWRGVQFNLQDDITQKMIQDHANIFSQLFDWQQHFYKWLSKDELLQNEDISLNDILAQEVWKERFTKRGLAFFYFLKYWVTYIQSSLPEKKEIQWRYFPGYNRLLKGFFVQMKQRPILKYPDALIESCFKLLINEKLVNPVIKILLNKVNVYDTSAVLRVIEYLNLIFKSFTTRKKSLPISFAYSYFFKGLKIILQSEFSIGISSVLSLIYNHFHLFHAQFRKSLSMYMLGNIFFKLFLNWSHTVRNIFYHLMTYKIYSEAHYGLQKNKFSIIDNDILARYEELMRIMQHQQTQYNKKKIEELQNNLDKHYYKKMRFKAHQKFNKNSSETSQLINTKAQSQIKGGEQQKYQLSQNNTRYNLTSSRKNIHIPQKQHSSQTNITARISNKQNLLDQTKRIKNRQSFEQNNQLSLFQKIIPEKLFEMQQIQYSKIKYICIYRPQFKEIQAQLMTCIEMENRACPNIKIQIAIDNREIRPQNIDDW